MNQNDLNLLVKQFARSMKIRNLSERTIKAKLWMLGKFLEHLAARGITHIDGITKDIVRAYQVELYQCINKKGRGRFNFKVHHPS